MHLFTLKTDTPAHAHQRILIVKFQTRSLYGPKFLTFHAALGHISKMKGSRAFSPWVILNSPPSSTIYHNQYATTIKATLDLEQCVLKFSTNGRRDALVIAFYKYLKSCFFLFTIALFPIFMSRGNIPDQIHEYRLLGISIKEICFYRPKQFNKSSQ